MSSFNILPSIKEELFNFLCPVRLFNSIFQFNRSSLPNKHILCSCCTHTISLPRNRCIKWNQWTTLCTILISCGFHCFLQRIYLANLIATQVKTNKCRMVNFHLSKFGPWHILYFGDAFDIKLLAWLYNMNR